MRIDGYVFWDSDERTNKGHIIVINRKPDEPKLYHFNWYKFTDLDWLDKVGKQGDSVSFEIEGDTAKKIRLKT